MQYEHRDLLLKYDLNRGTLMYLSNEKKFDVLWSVCKVIMIFTRGQSSLEKEFPVNSRGNLER